MANTSLAAASPTPVPYPPSPMVFHGGTPTTIGGTVLTSPRIYLDFWGPDWANPAAVDTKSGLSMPQVLTYVTTFFQSVGGSPWLGTTTQYCQNIPYLTADCAGAGSGNSVTNPFGQLKGVWNDPAPVPSVINDPLGGELSVANEAGAASSYFALLNGGKTDPNALYMVFTPHNRSTKNFISGLYCAYHEYDPRNQLLFSYVPYQPDAPGQLPNCGTNAVNGGQANGFGNGWLDGESMTAGHEWAESITDPNPPYVDFNVGSIVYVAAGWYDTQGQSALGEIGDKCQQGNTQLMQKTYLRSIPFGNVALGSHYFAVQSLWSNDDFGCVLGYKHRIGLPALDDGSQLVIQNRGSTSASVSLQYFGPAGDAVGLGDSDPHLPANASWVVRTNLAKPFSSLGSAVLYSDQPLAAVATRGSRGGTDTSSYSGVQLIGNTSSTLYAPRIVSTADALGNVTQSRISLINTDALSDATVTVTYRDAAGKAVHGVSCVTTLDGCSFTALARAQLDSATVPVLGVPSGFQGTATIQSSGPLLAGVVDEMGPGGQFSSYLAAPQGSTYGPSQALYAPVAIGPKPAAPTSCNVRSIQGGRNWGLSLGTDGVPRSWGDNTWGQLGLGTMNPSLVPQPVTGVPAITSIATQHLHAVALDATGHPWTWGLNEDGQLGNGTGVNSTTPVQVLGPGGNGYLGGITAVTVGDQDTIALQGSDGSVWNWGNNYTGQLGINSSSSNGPYYPTPVHVLNAPGQSGTYLTGVASISAGDRFVIALKPDGTVWAWGDTLFGATGVPYTANTYLPAQVQGPNFQGHLTSVAKIATQLITSMALLNDGTVWTWGGDAYGNGGDNQVRRENDAPVQVLGPGGLGHLSGVVSITGGWDHALALKDDGTLWAWGRDDSGQLGNGTTTVFNSGIGYPVQVGGLAGVKIVAIGAGRSQSFAVDADGNLWAWGGNQSGELGDGTTTSRSTPEKLSGVTVANPTCGSAISTPAVHTVISIQNPGGAGAQATLQFHDQAGKTIVNTYLVPPLGSVTLDQGSGPDALPMSATPYSVQISGDSPLVATVAQLPAPGGPATSTAYNAMTSQPGPAALPSLQSGGSSDLTTSAALMNTGSTQATVTLTYYDAATGAPLKAVQAMVAPYVVWSVPQAPDIPAGSAVAGVATTSGGSLAAVITGQFSGVLNGYTSP